MTDELVSDGTGSQWHRLSCLLLSSDGLKNASWLCWADWGARHSFCRADISVDGCLGLHVPLDDADGDEDAQQHGDKPSHHTANNNAGNLAIIELV